ncbi:MAG: TIGR03936 family radical SAM-associated protein [Planctomycetota bacterium]
MRQSPNIKPHDATRIRYRIRFAKLDLLRWISHRDLARLWERLTRRAELPLSMTEGFHPKPRIAFASALALGVESHDEVLELELSKELTVDELQQRLVADGQPGLSIIDVTRLDDGSPKAQLMAADYAVTLPDDFDETQRAPLRGAIEVLLQQETITVERKKKPLVAHVASHIPFLELHEKHLWARLFVGDGASLKITDVMQCIGIESWPQRGSQVSRTRVWLRDETPSSHSDIPVSIGDTEPLSRRTSHTFESEDLS